MKASQVSVCITPELYDKKSLSGFSVRSNNSVNIGPNSLYLSITWLNSGVDNLIIISVDALYIDSSFTDEVYAYIEENFAVNKSQVIFNASHTHSALSICSDIFGLEDNTYKSNLKKITIETIGLAFKRLEERVVRFKHFTLPTGLIVNRRRYARDIKSFFLKKKMIMAPNYDGYVDAQCRSLIIGNDMGVLFNLSCHPVFNTSNRISSDFPGGIRERLTSNFSSSAFAQGFCGDIRPNSVSEKIMFNDPVLFLKTLINRTSFKPATKDYYNFFCNEISQTIIKNSKPGEVLQGRIRTNIFSLELQSETGLSRRVVECKIVLLDSILVLSVPAEINSKYLQAIEEAFPYLEIMPMGYAENIIGYLPHWSEVEEGGYEVESYLNYGWDERISIQSLKKFESKVLNEINNIRSEE